MAFPPSPLKPAVPFPATVVMIPLVSTFRMRWLFRSAMYRLPCLSKPRLAGIFNCASVAFPPSPPNPDSPVPAKRVMFPLVSTLLMMLLSRLAIYKLPFLSTMNPSTSEISVSVALTIFAIAGMVQNTTHERIAKAVKNLRFFLSMFKPLDGRKYAWRILLSPIKTSKR